MKRILVLSNSEDLTADYLCHRLRKNAKIVRYNTDKRRNICYGSDVTSEKVDWVINRRPFENESDNQDPITKSEYTESVWNELGIIDWEKWINPPHVNWVSNKKAVTLREASLSGLAVPAWVITNSPIRAQKFLQLHSWNCVVKPINHGYFPLRGNIRLIYTNKVDPDHDLSKIKNCPTFFQVFIDKRFDVRVVYILGKIICVSIQKNHDNVDIRRNNMEGAKYQVIKMPNTVKLHFMTLAKRLNLRFTSSDFIVDKNGTWHFLENNPNGQWAWMDPILNGAISSLYLKAVLG